MTLNIMAFHMEALGINYGRNVFIEKALDVGLKKLLFLIIDALACRLQFLYTWARCCKNFYGCNLRMFVTS
jgi:hypothetical protein